MKHAISRLSIVAAAVTLGAATLGCGFISQAKQAVNNLTAISDVIELLDKSAQLTFTAEYTMVDGSGTTTVAQQPPNAAYLGKDGRFILTDESLFMCSGTGSRVTCQRSPNTGPAAGSADHAAYMQAVAGGGFISTPMALAMLTAASIVPGVKVESTERKLAGLNSTCLKATGIPSDNDPNTVEASEYTVCVADNGVLTEFTGLGTDGKEIGVKIAKYSDQVDAKAFAPPSGAKIVDVDQIQPN